jgi:undecaprenyl diphosphate synthase
MSKSSQHISCGLPTGSVKADTGRLHTLSHIAFIADGKHTSCGLPTGSVKADTGRSHTLSHIAFIADGNRRWARKHFLPRGIGHKRGFRKMIAVADHCADIGIPFVSFFAFSTENWGREKDEIDEIFRLIRDNLSKQIKHYVEKEIRVLFFGDLSKFPADFIQAANECMEKTKNLTRMTLCLCVNYGGRADILHAVNKIISGRLNPAERPSHLALSARSLTEADISNNLYTADIPEPDLVVRTGGECRISNFMLWQMAYSELKFVDTYWPDITNGMIDGIITEFNKRDRRNGK